MRRLSIMTFALACASASIGEANHLPVTITCTPRPAVVAPGNVFTLTITVTNPGPTDITPAGIIIGVPTSVTAPFPARALVIRSLRRPAGWTEVLTDLLLEGSFTFYNATYIIGERLRAGASVTFVAELQVQSIAWPGASIPLYVEFGGSVNGVNNWKIEVPTVQIRGSAVPPTTASRLTKTGPGIVANDLVYDSVNGVYLATNNGGVSVADTLGNILASTMPDSSPNFFLMSYSPDVTDGVTSGGAMLLFFRAGVLHARRITTQGLTLGPVQRVIESQPFNPGELSIAYSARSKIFLVMWTRCAGVGCRLQARLLNLEGQPQGPIIEVGAGADSRIVWNPVTDEFGVVFESGFARLSADGRLLAQTSAFDGMNIAVNTATGNYIVITQQLGGIFGLEINASGRVVSRGLISTAWEMHQDAFGLSYNPMSGTFLFNTFQFSASNILELNQHGAPLALPIDGCGSFTSRTDTAEWGVSASGDSSCTPQVVRTSSLNGGSHLRLGGCATPDPFVSLGGGYCYDGGWYPPGLDPPDWHPPLTGCVKPDPFVALGGGTCINGGWVPPSMTPSPVPPQPPPPPAGCTTQDPFASLGGGTCVNGGWLPPGMAAPPPSPPPPPTGCTIPDPFVSIGGGICQNGGWIPRGQP